MRSQKSANCTLRRGQLVVYQGQQCLLSCNRQPTVEESTSGMMAVHTMRQDVVGALEYDPEIPRRQRHREFLQQSVVFKEVVPIGDPAVRAKIHQTYRMGYLKARPRRSPLHCSHWPHPTPPSRRAAHLLYRQTWTITDITLLGTA